MFTRVVSIYMSFRLLNIAEVRGQEIQ